MLWSVSGAGAGATRSLASPARAARPAQELIAYRRVSRSTHTSAGTGQLPRHLPRQQPARPEARTGPRTEPGGPNSQSVLGRVLVHVRVRARADQKRSTRAGEFSSSKFPPPTYDPRSEQDLVEWRRASLLRRCRLVVVPRFPRPLNARIYRDNAIWHAGMFRRRHAVVSQRAPTRRCCVALDVAASTTARRCNHVSPRPGVEGLLRVKSACDHADGDSRRYLIM